MLWSPGMRLKRTPAGGWKPVAPPWLRSSVRSIHHSMSSGSTPNSCLSTPRDHSAAVCWYSGTPTRLPLRSAGFSMPLSVRDPAAGVEKAARGEDRQADPVAVAVGHGHQQRRQRHLGDVELLEVQLAPEDLGRVGGRTGQIDAVGLDGTVEDGTRSIVGAHNQTELKLGHWPSPMCLTRSGVIRIIQRGMRGLRRVA